MIWARRPCPLTSKRHDVMRKPSAISRSLVPHSNNCQMSSELELMRGDYVAQHSGRTIQWKIKLETQGIIWNIFHVADTVMDAVMGSPAIHSARRPNSQLLPVNFTHKSELSTFLEISQFIKTALPKFVSPLINRDCQIYCNLLHRVLHLW